MKHFTTFATTLLLWLCAITAWADGVVVETTTTAPNDVTEGYYLIKTRYKGNLYYAYHEPSGDRPFRVKAESSVDLTTLANNLQYVWYITKNANNQFVLQNALTGGFLPADQYRNKNCTAGTTTSTAAVLEAENFTAYTNSLEGGFLLKQCNYKNGSNNLYFHCNTPGGDPNLSYWDGNNVGDAQTTVQFAFYKVTLPDGTTTQATPAYGAQIKIKTADNKTLSSVWRTGLKANLVKSSFSVAHSYYWSFNGDITYGNAETMADMTLYATKGTVPVTLSTPESPVWFKLTMRNDRNHNNGQGNYLIANVANNNEVYSGNNEGTSHYGANYQATIMSLYGAYWAIVEDGLGVKLYNKATKKYVNVAEKDNKATFSDNGTTFYMQTSAAQGANFSLQYEDTWGFLGDHKSGYLGTWSNNNNSGAQNDNGSGYKVTAVDDTDLALATNIIEKFMPKAFSSQTNNDNALTMNTTEGAEKGKALLEKYNSSETKTWSLLDEIAFAIDVNFSAQPDLTAYYRIRNVDSELANRYLSSENIVVGTDGSLNTAYTNSQGSMDRKITRKSDSDNFGSQLWKFTKNNDGTFTLRNANTDREFGEAGTSPIEMPINISHGNGHYQFVPYTADAFTDYDANSMFVMYDNNNNQVGINGDNYVACNNDQFSNKSNYWQIIKVTEVPVNISTTAGWASVAYPFAVQVPSDVKAYIASTAEDDVLTLQEITDGIIPANTGALLTKAGGGLINLTITTTSTTYADNKLTGSTAERSGFTAKDTYVLASKSGKVGLYPSTLTIVPSNKAYLLKTNITTSASGEAQMMNFVVDGMVTGINTVESNANKTDNNTYYDLNGRRVLYPTRGIYVKGNGQKVFIK